MKNLALIYKRNSVYQIAYHVIWCPKYRRSVLIGKITSFLACLIDDICRENKWEILAKEIQADHIHLFLSFPPAIAISEAVKKLKGITARKLLLAFPKLKQQFWKDSLWSPSYYVGTAGNVSAEVIQKYIERTEHIKKRK